MIEENVHLLKSFGTHRGEAFNALVLPQSQPAIEAIGHAMAYSAAVKANLPQPILDIYECAVIQLDPAWYSEHGITRMDQRLREDAAISSALPQLDEYLDGLHIEEYVSSPMTSGAAWKDYVLTLPLYTGNALPESPQLQAML